MPLVGEAFDHYGPRWLLYIGSFLYVFDIMMASHGAEYYQILLAEGHLFCNWSISYLSAMHAHATSADSLVSHVVIVWASPVSMAGSSAGEEQHLESSLGYPNRSLQSW